MKKTKRLLSLFLALVMIMSLLPTVSLASGDTRETIMLKLHSGNLLEKIDAAGNTYGIYHSATEAQADGGADANGSAKLADLVAKDGSYSWVADKSSTLENAASTTSFSFYESGLVRRSIQYLLKYDGKRPAWPSADWPEASPESEAMFTLKTTIPEGAGGYYKIRLNGGKNAAGGVFAVYAGGKYVGDIDSYAASNTQIQDYVMSNAVKLSAGEVEISFRARKYRRANKDTAAIVLKTIELVPVEAASISEIENAIPNKMQLSESLNLTARVKMNDDTYRAFGYTDAGAVPETDNIIKVTSSNSDIIEVTDFVCVEENDAEDTAQEIDPTTTTFTLNAKAVGSAEITLTAIVDGKEEVIQKTVSVVKPRVLEKVEVSFEKSPLPKTRSTKAVLSLIGDDGEGYTKDYTVVYSSSDTAVAEIDEAGNITAKEEGTAEITVTVTTEDKPDGVVGKATLTVSPKPVLESFSLRAAKKVLIGSTTTVAATSVMMDDGVAGNASDYEYTFKGSNDKVATVSENGTLTAASLGKVSVTVTTVNENGREITAKAEIEVVSSLDTITLKLHHGNLEEKNADGSTSDIEHGTNNSAKIADLVAKDGSYEWVADKSANQEANTTSFSFYENSVVVRSMQYLVEYSKPAWPESDKEAMFTLRTEIPQGAAGYYKLRLNLGKNASGGVFAVYADGKYVGDIDTYSASNISSANYDLNSVVYLPEGDIEISFRARKYKKSGLNTAAMILAYIYLIPAEAPGISEVESDIPNIFAEGSTEELSARVRMSDNKYRSFGYAEDGKQPTAAGVTEDNIPQELNMVNVTSSDSEVVEVVEILNAPENDHDDVNQVLDSTTVTYKLKALKAGTADISVTAYIDGQAKTIKETVTVREPVMLKLHSGNLLEKIDADGNTYGIYHNATEAKADGVADEVAVANGSAKLADLVTKDGSYSWVADKSSTLENAASTTSFSFNESGLVRRSIQYLLKYDSNRPAWPSAEWPEKSPESEAMLTLKTSVPNTGYYKVRLNGGKNAAGGVFAVYAGGKYVGDIDSYAASNTQIQDYVLSNAVELSAGEVEISFRARKYRRANKDTAAIVLKTIELVPIETPRVSEIESEIPTVFTEGDTQELTAKVKMADESYRAFGYTDAGTAPVNDETVTIISSDSEVVEVKDVETIWQNIADDTAQEVDATAVTYKLAAKKAGIATITVTAYVDGKAETKTKRVVVRGTEAEEPLSYSGVIEEYLFYKKSADWVPTAVYDEGETNVEDVRGITYEHTENNYAWYGSTATSVNSALGYASEAETTGRLRMYRKAGEWTGVKINIPKSGRYAVDIGAIVARGEEGISDVYIMPADTPVEDVNDLMYEGNYIGELNSLDTTFVDRTLVHNWVGYIDVKEPGEYAVIFKARGDSYTTIRSITLDGSGISEKHRVVFKTTSESSTVAEICAGEKLPTELKVYRLDGTEIPAGKFDVEYKSFNIGRASVSSDGVITGIYDGAVRIDAYITYDGETVKAYCWVRVVDNSSMNKATLEIGAKQLYVGAKAELKAFAHMDSGNVHRVENTDVEYSLSSDPAGIAKIEDGYITALGEGTITLSAKVTYRDETKDTEEITAIIEPGTQKTEPTVYTYEMRKNALENAKKYDWAKSMQKTAIASADEFVRNLDAIYDMIVGEGMPRSGTISMVEDPEAYTCIYCKSDIREKHSYYSWGIDPINRPWKIQCPDCKRLFPSNDFESFFELGHIPGGFIDEKDNNKKFFDIDLARQRHHEMFVCQSGEECTCTAPAEVYSKEWYEFYGYGNEKGYLYNELYKDVGKDLGVAEGEVSRWAVDDGWGYDTGELLADGIPRRVAFIPFYNWAIWSPGAPYRYITKSIYTLQDAYLYTGDEKYGRAGAIIIDRVADVYPSFKFDIHLGYNLAYYDQTGKISDYGWERMLSKYFAQAYDAFWPAMDDPEVIAYLSAKAEEMGLENKKLTAEMIRKNCDDGICREIFTAVKERRIHSTTPYHQTSLAYAAIALDSMPDTQEMFDWMLEPSVRTTRTEERYGRTFEISTGNSGGELEIYYVDTLGRDGFTYQVSNLYNSPTATHLVELAELVQRYEALKNYSTGINFYDNPKMRKALTPYFSTYTMAGNYTLQVGDQYSTASTANETDKTVLLHAYKRLGDPKFAQQYYTVANGDLSQAYLSIFEKDAGELADEIREVVEEYGEAKPESRNLTGFGLAVLSAGEKASGSADFRRDSWMWYGQTSSSHAHWDALQMGIDAYGFNFMPDLGYPEQTANQPNRVQWAKHTLSHNTVMVDGEPQEGVSMGVPHHFDDAGKVGVIDVESPDTYKQAEIYRRTLVSVEASPEVDYTVDFFRVKGGDEHVYSFHTQSYNGVTTDGLNLVPQVDENGNYVGTYAGKDVEFGPDPWSTEVTQRYETKYPRGYTWLTEVRRDDNPEDGSFSVNFKQTDFNKQVEDSKGLNLRWTALNDWTPSGVGFATGYPPRHGSLTGGIPGLDYMLVHRKRETAVLDTLFTSVIEPYKGEEYIESMASVPLVSDGTEKKGDVAKAVKVKLKSGRTDYIIYSTNNTVVHTLTDGNVSFSFKGFVGVYSVDENGVNVYSYVNDGEFIGELTSTANAYGTVVDFTKELAHENSITVKLGNEVDPAELAGRFIYVNNSREPNGAYKIEGAKKDGENVVLDVGDVTLIYKYKDAKAPDNGFNYNIAAGNSFVIPLSASEDISPVFSEVQKNLTTSAGSSISVTVYADSPAGEGITYIGTHLPRGASLDSATGKITWKPDASQIGENGFFITARDDSGRESGISFDITVYGSTTGSSSSNDKTEENSGTSGGGGGGGGGGGAAPAPDGNTDNDVSSETGGDSVSEVGENTGVGTEDGSSSESVRFIDLESHSWAADAINELAEDGIIKGTSASTFSPASNITRADFALLLVRAFKLESENTENFADVSANDYFASELAAARNTGIVNGIGDNKFAPRNTITRQDMMVIVYRALTKLSVELEIADVTYEDFADVADYAKNAVKALITNGLVNGKNGLIAPTDYTTRAEVAVLIKRILDYVK